MKHDEFDDLLGEIARRSHNPPPPVPREAIWAGLEAARARGEGVRPGAEPNQRQQARLPLRWWGLGIAATLALGIGIGRVVERQGVPGMVPVPMPSATAEPGEPATAEVPILAAEPPRADGEVAGGVAVSAAGQLSRSDSRSDSRVRPPAPAPTSTEAARRATSSTYRLAALEHLVRTEVLLTSFKVDAREGRVDSELELWARDLLSTTRLLLDSPAATEPRLEGLLRDLELVLAQIAQYPESRAAGELELIDQALLDNDVITRLRLAVPPGPLLVRS